MFLFCSSSLHAKSQRESEGDLRGWYTACILLKLGDFPATSAPEIR